ncbi:MAG: hypothetical protein ABIG31_04835 [Candidatus Omnitrophota bacterium]
MRRKPIIEYGIMEDGYCFFLFYNYSHLDLKELVKKFPGIIENRYLLVTSLFSGKIEKAMFEGYMAKGILCEYMDGNLIVAPENTKNFINFLFSQDPGGSTIYFVNHRPRASEMQNKKIYGIPALPVSIKIFRRQRIDQPLLNILLREIESTGASFYYDNNWSEAIFILRHKRLLEDVKTFFHYNFALREVVFN